MINLIDTSEVFKQNLTKMLRTKLRIDEFIRILVNIMSVSEAKSKKMIGSNMISFNAQLMTSLIENQTNIIKILKLSILIQRCVIEQNTMGYGRILQKLIKKCEDHQKLPKLVCNELDTKTSEYFIKNLLLPLLFYLQRRLKVQENKKQSKRRPSILTQRNIKNKQNKQNNIKPKNAPQIKEIRLEKQQYFVINNQVRLLVQGCYLLVNLLNKFYVISHPLQTIIRYYGGCYGCFQDLNITIAIDIQKLYQQLQQKLQKIIGLVSFNVNQLILKGNKTVVQQAQKNLRIFQELKQLLKQIQKVKESVYYSLSLKPYIPNFINVQEMEEKLQGMKRKLMESKIALKKENNQEDIIDKYKRSKLMRSGCTNQRKNIDISRLSARNSNNKEEINNQQGYSWKKQNDFYGLNSISLEKQENQKDYQKEFERTMHSSTFSIRINEIEKQNFYQPEEKDYQNFSDLQLLQQLMKSIKMIEGSRNKKQNYLLNSEIKLVEL